MIYNGMEVYSVSMLHKFKGCRAYYDFRYNELLTHEGKSKNMSFGTAMHEGLAAWYKTKDIGLACSAITAKAEELELPATVDEDPKHSVERARKTMLDYVDHYKERDLNITAVEIPFLVEVQATYKGKDRPFLFAGTIDGLAEIELDGSEQLVIAEHKTTSQMGTNYIASYKPNDQITAYAWALKKYLDKPIKGAIINILYVLTHETNFIRHLTTRQQWELDRWELQLKQQVNDIRRAVDDESFYMNTDMCNKFGLCQYRTLCNTTPEYVANFMQAEYQKDIPGDLNWLFKGEKNE